MKLSINSKNCTTSTKESSKYPLFAATQAPVVSLQGEDLDCGGVAARRSGNA